MLDLWKWNGTEGNGLADDVKCSANAHKINLNASSKNLYERISYCKQCLTESKQCLNNTIDLFWLSQLIRRESDWNFGSNVPEVVDSDNAVQSSRRTSSRTLQQYEAQNTSLIDQLENKWPIKWFKASNMRAFYNAFACCTCEQQTAQCCVQTAFVHWCPLNGRTLARG